MEAFEAWRDQKEADGIEEDFRYGNRAGWRGAMEQVLKWQASGEVFPEDIDILINRELEEK